MGTNYYLQTDYCPCCGHPRQKIHLGKTSCGWKFLFHKRKKVQNYEDFKKFIQNGIIVDEYGNKHTTDDMLDVIDCFQSQKNHEDAEIIGGYNFLNEDFS